MKFVVLKKPPLFRRSIAFILDLMIVDLALFPFNWFFDQYVPKGSTMDVIQTIIEQNFSEMLIGMMLYFTIMVSYFVLFEYYLGKTPGKAIWKMKVISLEGEKNFYKYIIRSLQIFFLIPFWIVDILSVFSKTRDRLLEKASKTTVVID